MPKEIITGELNIMLSNFSDLHQRMKFVKRAREFARSTSSHETLVNLENALWYCDRLIKQLKQRAAAHNAVDIEN